MYLKKALSYNLKRILPVLTIAGASLFGACTKEDEPDLIIDPPKKETPKDTAEKPIKKHDIYFEFTPTSYQLLFGSTPDFGYGVSHIVRDSLKRPDVRYIYMVPKQGIWSTYYDRAIANFREKFLRYNIEYSPRVKGKGDFNFKPGEASKVREDSLWYIVHGWTINKNLQR